MSKLLLETIRCEQGQLQNLSWHQERMARSCRELFGTTHRVGLQHINVPPAAANGLFKCRVLYDDTQVLKVTFSPYAIRPVKKLRLVLADGLKYSHKFADRTKIEALFEQCGPDEDVLFVIRGLITDTSYANVALFDGSKWYTPLLPLLPGTRRAALISKGTLTPTDVPPHLLSDFQEIRLINAMMPLEEAPRLHPETGIKR